MTRTLTIALAGVTGRMGAARHLRGSLVPIAADGLASADGGSSVAIRMVLTGRDAAALKQLALETGAAWSTDLSAVVADPDVDVYFDARRPDVRPDSILAALQAGKHVYAEKPLALDLADVRALERAARERGLATGVVHDKLFTPGFRALRGLLDEGSLGRVLDVRGSFGYWVHDGTVRPAQRPSWNFRREDGGSLVQDLFTHWNYLLELIDRPVSVAALTATHIKERRDEGGRTYRATTDDVAHVLVRLRSGATASISSTWVERPMTPFTLVVHGTSATAHAIPSGCWITEEAMGSEVGAPWAGGPVGVWTSIEVEDGDEFRAQWTAFLRHVAFGESYPWTFSSALRAAELCYAIDASVRSASWCAVAPGMDVESPTIPFNYPTETTR